MKTESAKSEIYVGAVKGFATLNKSSRGQLFKYAEFGKGWRMPDG